MSKTSSNRAVQHALKLMRQHPSICNVEPTKTDKRGGSTLADVTFKVNLSNEWKRSGASPSSVRRNEIVRFEFPAHYPLIPPKYSLRTDFSRKFPHIEPWLDDGRPVPCIYDGDLAELFHSEGITGILNQIVDWLDRAAHGSLMDRQQGWEPIRRDSLDDLVIADANSLQDLVDRNGGYRLFQMNYAAERNDDTSMAVCEVSNERVTLRHEEVPNIFTQYGLETAYSFGQSVAIVAWPGKRPSGDLVITDTYIPEAVTDLNQLIHQARQYGCGQGFSDGVNVIRRRLAKFRSSNPIPIAVIFLVRRPFHIIGTSSLIELAPYVVDVKAPTSLFTNGDTVPRPAGHKHIVSRELLANLSGSSKVADRPQWTLVGAGSLGSKIALHLGRTGNGPSVVIDKSWMSPHNAARHALAPAANDTMLPWSFLKAEKLADVLQGLGQTASPITEDFVKATSDSQTKKSFCTKNTWAMVNATASVAVREALASADHLPARAIECSLFAGGQVGMISVEGPKRNPNTAALIAEFYEICRKQPGLAKIVFGEDDSLSRQTVGQGCGSMTMVMSDGRLSLFASAISEWLLSKQCDGLPDAGGEILIGRLSEDGMGLNWRTESMPAVTVVNVKRSQGWRIHVHERAATKIQKEISLWPDCETGGVLMGRISEAARIAYVVDVLDAPEDSTRSQNEFVLGKSGLNQAIDDYSRPIGHSLHCLGTWHSHLREDGPSAIDETTAQLVSLTRLTPSFFLIKTPKQYHAIASGLE